MARTLKENCTEVRYRNILRRKADDIRHALSAQRASEVVRLPGEPLDFGDWCQKSHDEWLFVNQNRLERALLRDVEDAISRIEDGSFGICQECGEAIPVRRLEAVPWARRCVSCQQGTGGVPAGVDEGCDEAQ